MQFLIKLLISNLVILACVWLGKRHPSLGGLIATMPLTSLIVLFWLYSDNPDDGRSMSAYVGGVFFGVMPTLLFFGATWLCLKKGVQLPGSLTVGCAVWCAGAAMHQYLLK